MESKGSKPVTLEQLTSAGFEQIGCWKFDANGIVRFLGKLPAEPGVYAFTANDQVCYIGSAQRSLRARLRKYDNVKNRGVVATRVRAKILEALNLSADVRVLFVVCAPISWRGLPIDPIAGLEEGLIRNLEPRWNIRGLASLRKRDALKANTDDFAHQRLDSFGERAAKPV